VISVVVCAYNQCESLRDTLNALKAQRLDCGIEMEISVVDNNSTDRTRQVVEEAAQGTLYPIRYVFEPRQGLSHARNRGIHETAGEWVAFTDQDTIPDPGWVAALWRGARQYQADCVGGPMVPLWERRPPNWLVHPGVEGEFQGMLAVLDRGGEPLIARATDRGFLNGGNMACHRSLFNVHGGFRTDLGPSGKRSLGGDDTEMLERLLRCGCRVVYLPGATVRHKVPASRMRVSYVRRWHFHSGRAIYRIWGNGPMPRWYLRETLVLGVRAIGAYCRCDWVRGICWEKRFWSQAGQIVESLARHG